MLPSKSLRASRIVPLLLLGLPAAAGCTAMAGFKPTQETAEKFLAEMQAGHEDQAYALCSAACKKAASQADIHQLWQTIVDARGPVDSWSWANTSWTTGTGGTRFALRYALKCQRGDCTLNLVLVPEGDAWLIQSVHYELGPESQPAEKPAETVERSRSRAGRV